MSAGHSRYFGFTKLVFIIGRYFMFLRWLIIMIAIAARLDVESNFITAGWPINGR